MRKIAVVFTVLLCSISAVFAQNTVKGRVTDMKDGTPIAGATIKVKGEKKSITSGADGSFEINVKPGSAIEISEVGHSPQTVQYDGSGDLDIKMTQDTKALSELVVTALGIKREKRNLTYSVQEVRGDAIVAAKQDNVVNSLAGKIPGVQITNSTGMPGSASRIVIRGATSLTGENQALFVIDGVPMDNSETGSPAAGSLTAGSSANRAIDIDPNIIESVTVLKGSAASAIYGSSGARGVVLITTKNGGLNKKAQLNFSSSYSIDNPILPGFQDKYAQGLNGVYVDGNNGQFGSGSWGPLIDTLKVNGVPVKKHNQAKEFFRTGHSYDNTVSVSGAANNSRYFFSYSYLKDDGLIPTTSLNRHAIFGKFSNQLADKLNLSFQMNYVNTDNHRTNEGNGLGNPLWTVYGAPISWDPLPSTNPDGTQRLYRAARNNPTWLVNNTGFQSNVNRFIPVAALTYTPYTWLTLTERLGADMYTDQSDYHEAKGIVGGLSPDGGVINRNENFKQFNNDFIADIHKQLTSKIYGSFLLGSNLFSKTDRFDQATGLGLGIDGFYNISNTSKQTSSSNLYRYRKVGFYAQANLEYEKLLTLALTGRYDGTSTLAQDKAYYPYGSAALGFIFSELMHDKSFLSFGKIRASYSLVGSDNIGPYALTTPYSSAVVSNITFPYNGQTGFLLNTTLGSNKLKNESLKEMEIGLDLKFLKNRLSFEGSYFKRTSSDLLAPIQIDPATGFTNANLNVATIENKGFELLLSGIPIKTKDVTWEINLNFSRIRNKVIDLGPGLNSYQFGGFSGGGGIYAFKDQPYGVIFGSRYKRNAAGRILVDDDGRAILDDNNGPVGNTNPNWTAGFSNTITYKGFSFNFVFDVKKGGDLFNFDEHYNWFYGTPKATEDRSPRLINGVRESDGKENTTQISAQTYFRDLSAIDEAVIEDGTYVKLRNAGISYTLSRAKMSRFPFSALTFTVAGRNLWIYKPHFYGSDPEANLQGGGNGQGLVNYMVPTTRSISFGLKATF
ncbi:SusC/RagA family TonB-linked outer membrane protein [Ferruginibacter paludis]|uniref:SusC/RagA family TonB-linked outer membrane protein n=1 Tax=Ferruginibacter paludis TaxID=1310417 RepID=UPI0025B51295|nr:SusC/RagA family TonB-linked outer membrane protein [Ferruginibacter paludis]MDN3657889.1 SusC/RagA family TonB-linked outer membrane protein [Ferruginibacter paludis]